MKLILNENNGNKDYVGVYSMGYTGLYIVSFDYYDDMVKWIWSDDYDKYGLDDNYIHESMIEDDYGDDEEYYADWYDYETNGSRYYFMAGSCRVYLDECMSV